MSVFETVPQPFFIPDSEMKPDKLSKDEEVEKKLKDLTKT